VYILTKFSGAREIWHRTFCSVCGSGFKARGKDEGGCWVMKVAEGWAVKEEQSGGGTLPKLVNSSAERSLLLTLSQRN